jgi:hypothetical protein
MVRESGSIADEVADARENAVEAEREFRLRRVRPLEHPGGDELSRWPGNAAAAASGVAFRLRTK